KYVAVEVRRCELVQAPRLRLRRRDNLRLTAPPPLVKVVYLVLACEIEPDHNGLAVALAKNGVHEHPALSSGNSGDGGVIAYPIDAKSELVFVIRHRSVDAADGQFRHRSRKIVVHGPSSSMRGLVQATECGSSALASN